MTNTAEENQAWVRAAVRRHGLTRWVESLAHELYHARAETEGL